MNNLFGKTLRSLMDGAEVKERALAEALRSVKDPRVQNAMVSVVHCDVTNDLRYAKCYISVLGSEQQAKDVMKGLKSAGGFLRRELGSALGLRYTPELIFEADDSIAYGAHILEVMHDVEKADAQRRIDHPESAGETEE